MRKLFGVLVGVLACGALVAGPAQACNYSGAETVFSRWGDQHSYVLGPDGGFEAGALGWQLSGGATTVEGNEPFYLHSGSDTRALALPAGGSVLSPPICMSIDTPIFRLFARNGGDPTARLRVEAIYPLLGLLRTKAVSTITAGPAWAPTPQLSTVLSLSTIVGTLIPSSIQIRIVPLDAGGQWQVDDLYIDPFARH